MKSTTQLTHEIFLLVLTLVSLSFLVLDVLDPSIISTFPVFWVDLFISLIFFFDFFFGFFHASSKKRYLRENWLQLLASLPAFTHTIQALQGFRFVRVLQIVRFIRIFYAAQQVMHLGEKRYDGKEFYLFSISIIAATLIFASSLVFFQSEYERNPNLHTFFDAIWWAIATVTTTGYGDIYPVTVVGRLVGIFLMFFGIGTFALVFSHVAEKFIRREERHLKHILEKSEYNNPTI